MIMMLMINDDNNDDDIDDYSKDSSFMIKHEWCMMHDNAMAPSYSETGEGDRGVGGQEKWNLSWNGGFCLLRCLLLVCVGKRCITASQFVDIYDIWLHLRGGWFMFDHDFGRQRISDKQFHSPFQSLSHQMWSTKNDHTDLSRQNLGPKPPAISLLAFLPSCSV